MAENNDRNIPNLQENIKCLGLEPLAINQYRFIRKSRSATKIFHSNLETFFGIQGFYCLSAIFDRNKLQNYKYIEISSWEVLTYGIFARVNLFSQNERASATSE
jgi:hypothetical protein